VKIVIPGKLRSKPGSRTRERVKPRRSLPEYTIAPTEKAAARELVRIAKKYVSKRHGDATCKKVFAAGLDEGKDKALKAARHEAHEFLLVRLEGEEAVFLELDKPDARWAFYRREGRDRLVSYFASEDASVTETGLFEYARECP